MIDEDEDQDECEICGEAHEARDCEETFCGACFESVENCDCEDCQEIDAAEWIQLGRPAPKTGEYAR